MIPDYAGNIWANTNLGLICVNPSRNDYKLANIYLDNFACDGNYIWFSDQGAIYQYDIKRNNKYKIPYQVSYGSAYSFVCSSKYIWVSSVDGILCIDKKIRVSHLTT